MIDQSQHVKLYIALKESCTLLQELNLYQGSKWSAEALNGLAPLSADQPMILYKEFKKNGNKYTSGYYYYNRNSKSSEIKGLGFNRLHDDNDNSELEVLEFMESDKLNLAKSYFSCHEYERCAHVLKQCKSNKAICMRLYSLYLSGERTKEDDTCGVLGPQDGKVQNKQLIIIIKELDEIKKQSKSSSIDDPFLLYLEGIVLSKLKSTELAQECFYKSLTLYPFNWSCWQDMLKNISTLSEAVKLLGRFSKNSRFMNDDLYMIMLLFFKITVHQEFFQQFNELNDELSYLLEIFPNFSFLKVQRALMLYNSLDYLAAEKIFDDVLVNDPYRLEDMDTYSNILYVMEKKSKLAFLAQFASQTDKFRPETCCIIANYYSLKFDHQKAIMYYKRAIALNRDCLSAWTLMGHEFVELKNSHAAIESYRRAVDTNNKDFRAWYGLGQAYEVLDMHLYSLYYYQRACMLKPLDRRMWQAVGNCCEKLGEYEDSIKAYKKSISVSSEIDTSTLYKLAKLYEFVNDKKSCALYMKLCVDDESNEGVTDETSNARLWLAKFERDNGNWQQAFEYSSQMTHGTSHEIEEARAIARESKLRMSQNQ
ncbi:hypothetical protein B5S28_g4146 [[Candida] boidinii]|nr:hypothetical protein B5S28_g4146 [[Candida] boidinii]OWB74111.1 hypothetical protein B5S31_g3890 [[Candida] boidinii]OWB80201.1 hypothetical protein B5S32_g4459 [[Candida] boidinii]